MNIRDDEYQDLLTGNSILQDEINSLKQELLKLKEEKAKKDKDYNLIYNEHNLLMVRNNIYRVALERIENECSRHDTTAWSIASDALEENLLLR